MPRRKKLKWGETPFDKMNRDELVRFAQASYAALESTRSCLAMSKHPNDTSLYWGKEGSGGRALFQADAVINEVQAKFDSETIYRSFFRYARDLLFPGMDRHTWLVCEKDNVMMKGVGDQPIRTECTDCGGPLRPITWADLAPTSPLAS